MFLPLYSSKQKAKMGLQYQLLSDPPVGRLRAELSNFRTLVHSQFSSRLSFISFSISNLLKRKVITYNPPLIHLFHQGLFGLLFRQVGA